MMMMMMLIVASLVNWCIDQLLSDLSRANESTTTTMNEWNEWFVRLVCSFDWPSDKSLVTMADRSITTLHYLIITGDTRSLSLSLDTMMNDCVIGMVPLTTNCVQIIITLATGHLPVRFHANWYVLLSPWFGITIWNTRFPPSQRMFLTLGNTDQTIFFCLSLSLFKKNMSDCTLLIVTITVTCIMRSLHRLSLFCCFLCFVWSCVPPHATLMLPPPPSPTFVHAHPVDPIWLRLYHSVPVSAKCRMVQFSSSPPYLIIWPLPLIDHVQWKNLAIEMVSDCRHASLA